MRDYPLMSVGLERCIAKQVGAECSGQSFVWVWAISLQSAVIDSRLFWATKYVGSGQEGNGLINVL